LPISGDLRSVGERGELAAVFSGRRGHIKASVHCLGGGRKYGSAGREALCIYDELKKMGNTTLLQAYFPNKRPNLFPKYAENA